MSFGPDSAAVVNGDVCVCRFLDGLAEIAAYGNVRNFFLGNSNLLVEKGVGGELPDNRFNFRIVRKGLQRYGFRGFGEDGRLFIRGEDDLGDSCVAQPVPRVAEQGAGPEMPLGSMTWVWPPRMTSMFGEYFIILRS